MRPQTLCSLRAPDDYRRGATTLKIRSEADKSRWAREVPLSEGACEAFDSVCPDAGYLFPRMKSGGPACYRMTLRKAAREAGLSNERAASISDYDFRHGRTTHFVEKSGNILGAGYLVGHKNATTTNTYLRRTAVWRRTCSRWLLATCRRARTSQLSKRATNPLRRPPQSHSRAHSPTPTCPQNHEYLRNTCALSILREFRRLGMLGKEASHLQQLCEEQDLKLIASTESSGNLGNLRRQPRAQKHWEKSDLECSPSNGARVCSPLEHQQRAALLSEAADVLRGAGRSDLADAVTGALETLTEGRGALATPLE